MKINLLNSYRPDSTGTGAVSLEPRNFKKRTAEGLCVKQNETREYSVSFSGNPAAKANEVAAKTLGDKILSSKTFGAMLEYAEDHPISCNALFSLILAGVCRPLTIMALPDEISGKNKKDKMNAAAHAVASGVIGFISSTIIMSPFDAAMKKVKADPAKWLGIGKKAESYLGDLRAKGLTKTPKFKNVEKLIKMGPDIVIGIPRSMITIALIPPILKYVFGMDPKKDKLKEKEVKTENQNNENLKFAGSVAQSPAFDAVKGGVK